MLFRSEASPDSLPLYVSHLSGKNQARIVDTSGHIACIEMAHLGTNLLKCQLPVWVAHLVGSAIIAGKVDHSLLLPSSYK